MNQYRLFRMLSFVAFFPFLLAISLSAYGDQGGQHDRGASSAEVATTPATVSSIWARITAKRHAIAGLIQNKQLKGIHQETEVLEALGDQLLKSSTMLDESKVARVRGAVNQMRQVAGSLHDAADTEDAPGAAAEFEKLEGLLKLIEAQYPAGVLSE